ncbi:MAG: response regulator transcription factor [Campylobacterales bacterium]|nr:response regulator transcription factor [Campylobacterales bacterium]
MKQILLLEDDLSLAHTLRDMLTDEGYGVTCVYDGAQAAEAAYAQRFDLYVFDVNVPLMNGFSLLESLRDARDLTPTLFISALVDLQSLSQGFRAGAFDYIKKPFFPEELLLRIEAKIGTTQPLHVWGAWSYDPRMHSAYKDEALVALGEVQLRLFGLFMSRIGVLIDNDELLEALEHPSPTALRVAINKLRHTTGLEITNIRSVGYRLEPRHS